MGPHPDGWRFSGGAAAAVAAGPVPLAQGRTAAARSDPGVLLRTVGLKPTRGRISGHPMYGDLVVWRRPGRSPDRARRGGDARRARWSSGGGPVLAPPPSSSFLSSRDRDPGRFRVARFIEPVITDTPVDPDCVQAWEDAPLLLESLGHEVVDVAVPAARGRAALRDLLGRAHRAVRRPAREGSTCCGR